MKYSKANNSEMSKVVKNFNAKIDRLIKKGYDSTILPGKIKVSSLKQQIVNKRDYNRIVNLYRAFSKKGAESIKSNKYGVKYTLWEKNKLKNEIKRLNYQRQKKLEKANPTTNKGTMGSIKERNLNPKKVNLQNITTQKGFRNVLSGIEKQLSPSYASERAATYKSNYIQAWYVVFGLEGLDILERITKIPDDIIYNLFYEDPRFQIDFIYDPYELKGKLSQIDNALSRMGY